MSDDLIKQLHNVRLEGLQELCWKAADRIAQLEESNKELTLQLLATSGQAADALDKLAKAMDALQDRLDTANKARADANFRANENQFKLAEAVEVLRWYADFGNHLAGIRAYAPIDLDKGCKAEKVLAELEK